MPKTPNYGSVAAKDCSWIAVGGMSGSLDGGYCDTIAHPRQGHCERGFSFDGIELLGKQGIEDEVCFKASSNPPAKPMPRTREHILLARQVGQVGRGF